ncbi:retrovirus-related pol polyprotein LINE-1 [Tanacetum coccineum]
MSCKSAADGYAGVHGGFGFGAVARAKDKAYEDLYKKLDSKEGANDIYKIAKPRERRRRDLGNVRYIKYERGRTIVTEEDIRKRCGEYFYSLFNESSHEGREVGNASPYLPQDCYYSRINQREVRIALQKMGRNKVIFSSAKMPDEWRLSKVIPIYKNKGDVQACGNYRGIKLLSHTMKLWERVIERRLRRETRVTENQFGFMPGRSTTEAIHLLRSLMEKYRERQRDLHMDFLDLENAYDSI